MKVNIEKSFDRDVGRVKDKKLLRLLLDVIYLIEDSKFIYEIPHMKNIQGFNSL